MAQVLVVATANPHKIDEIRAILTESMPGQALPELRPLRDFTDFEPVEDGRTFKENSLIKARAARDATGLPALADDSGLVVDVMGAAPGIFSARWAGQHGDDRANRELLLAQMRDVPAAQRTAAFIAAVSLALPNGEEYVVEGRMLGAIAGAEAGNGGFGYDPIFVPAGHSRTTAEMSPTEKNDLSHRGAALRKIVPHLQRALRA